MSRYPGLGCGWGCLDPLVCLTHTDVDLDHEPITGWAGKDNETTVSYHGVNTLRLLLKTGFRLAPIMKYLEYTPLDRINNFLSHLPLGQRSIEGCLEAYSCKHTGTDKKLSLSLETEIVEHLGKSSDATSLSPVEYLFSRSSRKTLIYLLLTLHQIYPDFIFSAVRAHDFFVEESWDSFRQIFDVYMFEASKEWLEENEGGTLLETLHKALDEVVKLSECEIYSYNPEAEADPFLEKGAIWSYHFFFYNRKLKRVVTFRFSCLSNLVSGGFYPQESSLEEDGEIFDDMDI